jgi:dTDP-4-amino-4,6-dideoxygalactose transaminase
MKHLNDNGVQTGLHYPMPLHKQKAYSYLNYKDGDFPVASKGCSEILSIPMFPEMTEEQVHYVCSTIKNFYTK